MNLTPREKDKLMISLAAIVARERLKRGVKLNYPESVALITDFVLEAARDGKSVAALMSESRKVLRRDQLMEGIAEMIPEMQVEATFPDGTKLVSIHNPISWGRTEMIAGEIFPARGEIVLNSQSSKAERMLMAKKVTVYSQPGWMFCGLVKEYLSQKQIQFEDRDITKDPSVLLELKNLGFMTTPVTVVDDKVIVGFDVPKMDKALKE